MIEKLIGNKFKKLTILISASIILIVIIMFTIKKVTLASLSKEIITEQIEKPKEVEWLGEEYENGVNIDEIIQKNIDDEIKTVIETKIVELEYQTEYLNTNDLPIGTIKVTQEGEDGQQELVIKKQYKGEKLIVDEQIGSRVITPTLNKIIQIGTGKFNDIINNSGNLTQYSKKQLLRSLNKNMPLNKPSGLTLEQFKKIFEGESKDKNGVFRENAEYFYYVEQVYGINGVFVAALGIHESAWGTSRIAIDKLNLFGYGAYDMNAYASAYKYNGYAAGIDMVARVLMKNYLNPKGTKLCNGEIATGKYYYGNKLSAVNKKYATDKKWADGVYKWMQYLYNRL